MTEKTLEKPRGLLHSIGVVSGNTLISRISGFIRDMVMAHLFGATMGMDAFLVAFKIPQFLRRLFAEGAFAQAFIPVVAEYRQTKSHDEMRDLIRYTSGTLSCVLLIVTVIAVLAAPLLIKLFAPGYVYGSTRFELAQSLLRITFPYLFFVSLTAFGGAVLNTHGRFGIPAFTPVFLNLCMILAAIFVAPYFSRPVEALAWGVFIAGIVQLVFQFPALKKLNLLPLPRVKLKHPGVSRILRSMVPALFGVSVGQLSVLLDTVFASFLQVGSITWLYYADRLMQFPLGIFGVGISTVIMPHLSRKFADKSEQDYTKTLDWALRSVLLIAIPAGLGLGMLAIPIFATLFRYGHFSVNDMVMTSRALLAFSLGLPAFMLVKVLTAGFYARHDIRTPVRIAVIAMITNMIFNAILFLPLAHVGLALSTSISSSLNAFLLFHLLRKRQIFNAQAGWKRYLWQLALANVVMVIFIYGTSGSIEQWINWDWHVRMTHLIFLLLGSAFFYVATLTLTGIRLRDFRGIQVSRD